MQNEHDVELILDPRSPLSSARRIVQHAFSIGGQRLIQFQHGLFFVWNGVCYENLDENTMRANIYELLDRATKFDSKTGGEVPFHPNTRKVNEIVDALRALTNLSPTVQAPAWLIEEHVPDLTHSPNEILVCRNGLLHLPSGDLRPLTPDFFSLNALSYCFDPGAGADASNWLRFLDSLWPNDPESIETLQDVFGYFLTPDTSQQKIFMIIGPTRSGKSTIARVLRQLLGPRNVCAPTLVGLGDRFGIEPLIGKTAAIIADARIGSRSNQADIAERLLAISGEDAVTVDRKYNSAWTGELTTRFLLLSNELPRLNDASAALPARFVILQLLVSHLGKEDRGLASRIIEEMPAVLNWAIIGWHRLRERGYFLQPDSARGATEDLERLSSPISAFIADRCIVDAGMEVSVDTLFDAWKNWCMTQERRPGTKTTFGRDLRAALPGIHICQHHTERKKGERFYQGMGLTR